MDGDRHGSDIAHRACGDDGLERIDVTHLVAQDRDRSGVVAGDQPFDSLALTARLARTQIDDGSAAVMREAMDETEPSFDCLDRCDHGGTRGGDVVGLAHVERHRRALAFHEQPRRRSELSSDADGQCFCGIAVDVERRVGRDDELFRTPSTWQPRVLETVIAQVVDATDAHPSGDVGNDATGEHRESEAVRARGSDSGEPPKSALCERLDPRYGGIARTDRERAIEVDHEQERRLSRQKRRQGSADLGGRRDRRSPRRRGATGSPGAGRRHGWTAAVLGDADADGTAFGFADSEALAAADGDALGLGLALGDPEPDGLGDTDADTLGDGSSANDGGGWGARVGAAPGIGAKRRIPPRTSAAAAIPVSRPATIDSRGHMLARRVPVRTPRGASGRFARASDTMRLRWPDRPMSFEHACCRRS